MAYHFTAEKSGAYDLPQLHAHLTEQSLIECFPVEVEESSLILGMSIPFKNMDAPKFEPRLISTMRFLIVEQGFTVIDLWRGDPVREAQILGLAQKIAG